MCGADIEFVLEDMMCADSYLISRVLLCCWSRYTYHSYIPNTLSNDSTTDVSVRCTRFVVSFPFLLFLFSPLLSSFPEISTVQQYRATLRTALHYTTLHYIPNQITQFPRNKVLLTQEREGRKQRLFHSPRYLPSLPFPSVSFSSFPLASLLFPCPASSHFVLTA